MTAEAEARFDAVVAEANLTEDERVCDGCGWETDRLMRAFRPFARERGEEGVLLCEVCWASPAGNAALYPAQHPQAEVLQQVAFGTNLVLAELRKRLAAPVDCPSCGAARLLVPGGACARCGHVEPGGAS